jgi:3-oxoacyl-[acyl-carrier-protein] synthase II
VRRVVVTGLGTVNPLGKDVDSFWEAALEGRSGVGQISAFDASGLKVTIAAEVPDFDPEEYIERKEARRLDRYDQLFWASTHQALADSGIEYKEGDPGALRAGVVVGSGIGGMISFQDGVDTMRQRGHDRVSPLAITQIISNMAAGLVSIRYNLLGPNTCAVTACAASANAIGDAAEIIKRDAADVMVAGGGEAPERFPLETTIPSEQAVLLMRAATALSWGRGRRLSSWRKGSTQWLAEPISTPK